MFLFASLTAFATPNDERPDDGRDPDRTTWGGVVIPLLGANSQDGFGLGLGGEIFARPASMDEGYKAKITAALWATTNLTYTNDYAQIDVRGETDWLGRAGFRGWTNHAFACLLYTSPSPRDLSTSRMPSSA